MVGIYVAQMGDAVPLCPGGEAGCSPGVAFPCARVSDMGGEEPDDAAGGLGIGRQEGRGRPSPLRCTGSEGVVLREAGRSWNRTAPIL